MCSCISCIANVGRAKKKKWFLNETTRREKEEEKIKHKKKGNKKHQQKSIVVGWVGSEMKLIKKQNRCKKLKPDKIKNAQWKLNKNGLQSVRKRPPANVSMRGKHKAKHKFDYKTLPSWSFSVFTDSSSFSFFLFYFLKKEEIKKKVLKILANLNERETSEGKSWFLLFHLGTCSC